MANNCKAVFVNNTPLVCTVTDNGDGTYTFNNHIDPPVTWSTGGTDTDTSIVFNQVLPNGDWEFNVVDVLTNTVLTTFTVPAPTISIIDNVDNTFTYIDVAGNPTVISYEHTLVDNNDGTFTFTQPDGTPTTIDVCKLQQDSGCASTMVDNGDDTYTYTDINGVSTTFTGGVANVLTTITNTITGHKIADYTDENGGVTPIYETISTLVNNGDGTATFTNEAGAPITFPIGGVTATDNGDGTYTLTLANGSTVTIADTSTSTMVDNLDGTYTYTDETGATTTFSTVDVTTTITNTITGNKIADYTNELGVVVPINESVTSFAAITNGYQFVSENGTVYPFTFTFDNTTPSAPQLLVNYGATVVSIIPLNSYDVNIATTGGFTLNPLTDEITITETDGETHVIDLSYLKTTLTSTDGSVEIVTSINPDGSTNYDLGAKAPSFETQAIPYTGVELPTAPGINIGDTNSTQFNDGTVVNYTWDGTAWVVNFVEYAFNPLHETTCTSHDEKIVVKKADGTFVTRDANTIKRNEVFPVGNYTIINDDEIIYAVGGSTITLPNCNTTCKEKTIYRDACSDGLITVLPPSGQTIDGVHASRTLEVGRGAFTYECINGAWRIKSEFFEQDQSCASFSVLNTASAAVTVYTLDGLPYSVDWGDSTNSGPIASGVQASKAYGSNFTGDIKICKTCGVAPIWRVNFNTGNWNFDINALNQFPNLTHVEIYSGITTGDIVNLPSGLTLYANYGQNTVSGDIANLPSGLTYYANNGQNTTSGDIANLPNGLTYYNNYGQNTTSGDIANLPNGLTVYANEGQNTTSGDIANLPNGLTVYSNSGQNTTSGDIANLPSGLTVYSNNGQNTTSGDIANLPNGLTYYANNGQNTTSGDIANLPSGLTVYHNTGQNTTSGDIANLPNGLTYYANNGQNTTSGDIANLPNGLTYYNNSGQNTTSGDIANLPSGLTYYSNNGQNTVSDYSGGNLNSGITYFLSITTSGGLSSSEVDDLFIELESTLPGIGYINISGTNAAPTAASAAARASLVAAGTTVIHN